MVEHRPVVPIEVKHLNKVVVLSLESFVSCESRVLWPDDKQDENKHIDDLYHEANPKNERDKDPVCLHPCSVIDLTLEHNTDDDFKESGMSEENELLPEKNSSHLIDHVGWPDIFEFK